KCNIPDRSKSRLSERCVPWPTPNKERTPKKWCGSIEEYKMQREGFEQHCLLTDRCSTHYGVEGVWVAAFSTDWRPRLLLLKPSRLRCLRYMIRRFLRCTGCHQAQRA